MFSWFLKIKAKIKPKIVARSLYSRKRFNSISLAEIGFSSSSHDSRSGRIGDERGRLKYGSTNL